MKIVILGAGNAGCLTALHYAFYTRNMSNVEIELMYDPSIPSEKTGQGSLPDIPNLLWTALGLAPYDKQGMQFTFKTGILYENWGKKKDKIFHEFPLHALSIHSDTSKFQDVILKSGWFKVTHKKIIDPNSVDADWIFDCRGKPQSFENYNMLESPLNSALLSVEKVHDKDQHWTRSVATPDGWAFIIPNTDSTTSYGYLYNRNITTQLKARENASSLFNMTSAKSLNFNSYMAKEPIQERVILNGNKLFFYEPLEATALGMYQHWIKLTFGAIFYKDNKFKYICNEIQSRMQEVKNFILWHYHNGSKYDTPFWKYAKNFKISDPDFYEKLKMSRDLKWSDVRCAENENSYGQWLAWNFKTWDEGVN